jgi:hypothetical protein
MIKDCILNNSLDNLIIPNHALKILLRATSLPRTGFSPLNVPVDIHPENLGSVGHF